MKKYIISLLLVAFLFAPFSVRAQTTDELIRQIQEQIVIILQKIIELQTQLLALQLQEAQQVTNTQTTEQTITSEPQQVTQESSIGTTPQQEETITTSPVPAPQPTPTPVVTSQPRFTAPPSMTNFYRSMPYQSDYPNWKFLLSFNFENADAVGFVCTSPGLPERRNNRITGVEISTRVSGYGWGTTWNCVATLQNIVNNSVVWLEATQTFSFTTPQENASGHCLPGKSESGPINGVYQCE